MADPIDPHQLDQLLRRLAYHRSAVVPVASLPAVLGVAAAEARAIRGALELAGLLEAWPDSPDGPAVVLSAMAARRLRVELVVEDDTSATTKTGTRVLPWIRASKVRSERAEGVTFADLFGGVEAEGEDGDRAGAEGLADPQAEDPAEAAQRAEPNQPPGDADRNFGKRLEGLAWLARNRVIRVLGLRVTWPVKCVPGLPCPGCGGRRLEMHEACVVDGCDRSGIDRWLPPVPASERPKAYRGDPDGLAGGKGKGAAKRSTSEGKPDAGDKARAARSA